MLGHDPILLVFAPALVGLLVMALRRARAGFYWSSLAALLIILLVTATPLLMQTEGSSFELLGVAVLLVAVPLVTAFAVGRLVMVSNGGAYVFAAASTAFLMGLAVAVALANLIQVMTL